MSDFQVTKSNTNPNELGGLANQLTNEFGELASEAKCAAITAESDEVQVQVQLRRKLTEN